MLEFRKLAGGGKYNDGKSKNLYNTYLTLL